MFQTGSNEWKSYDAWPPVRGIQKRGLYLREGGKLAFDAPTGDPAFDAYVSDPSHPGPYRLRPIPPTYQGPGWNIWHTDDQRFIDGRPDVAVWKTEPLTQDISIAGQVIADIFAATSGTDSDWIVKLIDVYPDAIPSQVEMGGYELPIAMDIFRGRYRESFEKPSPIPANKVQRYRFDLPPANHVFLPGHRIMVQVQSSWFPLYDRNPQTFVPNIFWAKPSDFRKATQRIYHAPGQATFIELPLVTMP